MATEKSAPDTNALPVATYLRLEHAGAPRGGETGHFLGRAYNTPSVARAPSCAFVLGYRSVAGRARKEKQPDRARSTQPQPFVRESTHGLLGRKTDQEVVDKQPCVLTRTLLEKPRPFLVAPAHVRTLVGS